MRDLESSLPMKTDTIFRIASRTKALTSVSIMILQERGLLNLNDRLSEYIPAWKNSVVMVLDDTEGITQVPALREITLHDLITHTAGIGWRPLQKDYEEANVFGWYFADENRTVAEVLAVLPSLPQPGEKFVYGYSTRFTGGSC
jgi:CubicO group peptidase (beta-lactamase class C family)